MLKEFRVDNFKSLINGVFRPQGMNLLLGMNNSGKTSLCQALQFVSGSAAAPLDRCGCGRAGAFRHDQFHAGQVRDRLSCQSSCSLSR